MVAEHVPAAFELPVLAERMSPGRYRYYSNRMLSDIAQSFAGTSLQHSTGDWNSEKIVC